MGAVVLPCGVDKVCARLLLAEKKYSDYINNICELEDIEFSNDLFVKVCGKSVDFGDIEDVYVYYKLGLEYWYITTSKSTFEFQILNKPQLKEHEKEINIDEFSKIRMRKKYYEAIEMFLGECSASLD